MLPKLLIGLFLFVMAADASAQKKEPPVNWHKDKKQVDNFTIRLLPSIGNTYGYEIQVAEITLERQYYNPFAKAPMGFRKKEDAYKVATWVIKEFKKTGRMPHHFPPNVAHELKVPIF
ncbi:MAG: DUF4907 domain-containing protein [Bacteroidota bacterium]|nr:DUF4907 domain-containing protein [Bacteroidota bacterium]